MALRHEIVDPVCDGSASRRGRPARNALDWDLSRVRLKVAFARAPRGVWLAAIGDAVIVRCTLSARETVAIAPTFDIGAIWLCARLAAWCIGRTAEWRTQRLRPTLIRPTNCRALAVEDASACETRLDIRAHITRNAELTSVAQLTHARAQALTAAVERLRARRVVAVATWRISGRAEHLLACASSVARTAGARGGSRLTDLGAGAVRRCTDHVVPAFRVVRAILRLVERASRDACDQHHCCRPPFSPPCPENPHGSSLA